ncbi:hypothetical protein EYF80_007921 [Liparis tanakae]|uniref:Uncharacterized protein n=1 Tax=Liparis tanakae TaxID=230148 RepID=A0A4Z2IWY3_9TELE|nr:hypothetical protein EYF80_007921 [Liparis tanakae]
MEGRERVRESTGRIQVVEDEMKRSSLYALGFSTTGFAHLQTVGLDSLSQSSRVAFMWQTGTRTWYEARPSPQSQRWNSSKPWVPFLRWRVHTWPSDSTGLQMRDQKCLAQHRLSEQSADLRQRFPAQHMASRAQRFLLFRQGRQAPRASLQNSSPSQSSSSVQTPDC